MTGATLESARTKALSPDDGRERVAERRAIRTVVVFIGLGVVLSAAFLQALVYGSTAVPLAAVLDVLRGRDTYDRAALVVSSVRLPRALTAMLAGAALGTAGLQMQTVLRNPLADPFSLGITSGAGLGVALVVLAPVAGLAAFSTSSGLAGDALLLAASLFGAALVLTAVLTAARWLAQPATILVVGLMFGYVASAIVTILVGFSAPERLIELARWSFGSFAGVSWPRLAFFAPVVVAGILAACATVTPLNVLLLGDDYARSMGVAVVPLRLLTMAVASTLGAVVTAFCGPIAFLGIAVPHLCRGVFRTADHRVLMPAVALSGAAVALIAQATSLVAGAGSVLPLNAVMALIGAPAVVSVLWRHGRRGE